MQSVLITGVNGFVGPYVAHEFIRSGIDVHGIAGPHTKPQSEDLKYSSLQTVDLLDQESVASIDMSNIDGVIHLAGAVSVVNSFDNPDEYIEANKQMQTNLFETAIKQEVRPKFVVASSGGVYDGSEARPSTEESEVKPLSPYVSGKLSQEAIVRHFGENFDFPYIIVRGFNQIGPGTRTSFLVGSLACQIISFANEQSSHISVGNLEAARDYVDVRDVAKAYRMLTESNISGEIYNVCSGIATTGNELLTMMAEAVDLKPVVIQDPGKMRPTDTKLSVGSSIKIQKALGWQPEFTLATTLSDIINFQRFTARTNN